MEADRKVKNKPTDSKFKQQKLPAWKPILTPRTVLPTFAVVGTVFLAIGIALLVASNGVLEQSWDYTSCTDKVTGAPCSYLLDNTTLGYTNVSQLDKRCRCEVQVDLTSGFGTTTTYLYYGLDNFFQNHRRYVKSRWDLQLSSDTVKGDIDCDPLTTAPSGLPYVPCGLIANSLFNDTIRLYRCLNASCTSRSQISLSGFQISWASDREKKFQNPTSDSALCTYGPWLETSAAKPPNWPVRACMLGGPNTTYNPWAAEFGSSGRGYQNEDLIVWMRTAALPNFRKLYRHVIDPLPNGHYVFAIDYNYPVVSFSGSKHVILSTASWLGGQNPFLGVCYIVVACLCLGSMVFFIVFQHFKPRHIADDKFLKWDRD